MLTLSNAEELQNAFREIDRDAVIIPHDFKFPVEIEDYLSWVDISSRRTFLVFGNIHNVPFGVVFRRGSGSGSEWPAAMCEWCHAVRGGGAVGLMTTRISKKRTIGMTLCRDLSCKAKIEDLPGVNDLRIGRSRGDNIMRITAKMNIFAKQYLF